MKPRIVISQRVEVRLSGLAEPERRDELDQRWSQLLEAAGLLPFPVPNFLTAETLGDWLEALQPTGMLLSGGNSLVSCEGDAPERDASEDLLLAWARRQQLPLLGVCRGMQVVQAAFGVRLQRVPGHVQASQVIEINGKQQSVNAYHHWGALDSVPELTVWARAADGVVKAVRHAHEPLQGIMWHPERLRPFRAADLALLRQIFGA